jgi:hypothetical protein
VTIRQLTLLVAALIWVAAPVLACMPTAAMTDAEMACCQKMGGDCDMGTGNHACCKDTMYRAPSVAAVAQASQTDVPLVALATISMDDVSDEILVQQNGAGFRLSVFPPGSSPLALNSILRN